MIPERTLFFRHMAQTSSFPLALEIDYAEGVWMYDREGKPYLDLISGIAVSSIGHRHPKVVKAVKEQAERYMHLMVYGEFIQSPQLALARLLCEHLPAALDNVYLLNSGSEAVEGAIKLAKRYTGRTELVSFRNAYHGSTQGSLSVTGNEQLKYAFRPLLPDVRFLPFNQMEHLQQITSRTACVIAETIQGEAGAVVPDIGFMKALRQRCDDTGALLILDEIQAGCGRTGSLWAFEQFGIVPDILTLAKALGGGMPIGAFISSRQIMQCLMNDPVLGHISTFGGNAVCAAAARANLEVIIEGKLWEGANEKEKLFRELLQHPDIKNIHGRGLMLAVEFESFAKNRKVILHCLDHGVLTDWFLFADNRLRIAPPLIIGENEIRQACATIMKALD
jgi:acetylornithine/N-succinyldiaminopimelate aminotransferase